MNNPKELSRLTSDIPKHYHLKIKSIALLTGKTIREVLIDAIHIECIPSTHIPKHVKCLMESKKEKMYYTAKMLIRSLKNLGSKHAESHLSNKIC
jgi:hypothetical protein